MWIKKVEACYVNIENIDLKCIHNLTNKKCDVDGDNENDRDNRDDGVDKDDRDNGDDGKSNSYLENTELRLIALKSVYEILYNCVFHVSSSELSGCITRFVFYSKVKSSIFIVTSGVSSSSVKWDINAFDPSLTFLFFSFIVSLAHNRILFDA
ncbi:conserved hypothetical protein [Coccidioides posadasii str. Silveira]|uniref:Uncharacterized protein n=1 Tax=Coccidioides posadasii (strain RMSCC 757 / Silveira) TaxID=443226 RepID=E9D787_COCPS|nr:conserved hypothetical protein [Coccidioides posadasii str. Silveira]